MRSLLWITSLLLIISVACAYIYHMPVNIQSTVDPAVLMPGDEAIIAIELENGAAEYGAGGESVAGTIAHSALISTPLNATKLKGTDMIDVLTEDYHNLGMIGPTDRITIYYKIRASENATRGTHLLDFEVQGGYDSITIHRTIPVKVDPAAVTLTRAEDTTMGSINLNVANPRENTVNAVTIIPSARGVRFSPEEYYIGTMDPDEVFTISFKVDPIGQTELNAPTNLSFVARFKNGETWHESEVYETRYSPPRVEPKRNNLLFAGIAVLLLIPAAYIYRRKRLKVQ
ncbi:hypothetical protein [Methanothrix sp.]|jgi:hypothetical protein|uniref:hypothetical protein n=1 Tax=Methanothrix sp. TaxID=90426 RepID=UPI00257A734E|nr:hypothetical protein [Methanothrix sp.]NPU87597.1 hypothetical protein [Methanothrix sp.]